MSDERYERRYDRDRYDRDDRGFFERAGDEVRSWFGDDEAERRRRRDEQYDERFDRGGYGRGGDRAGYARSEEQARGYGGPDAYPRWHRSNHDDHRRGYAAGGYAGFDQEVEAGRRFDTGRRYGGRDRSDYASAGYGRGGPADRDDRESPRGDDRASGSGDGTGYGYPSGRPGGDHDDYHGWRQWQVSAFDRDYDEYRRENRSRFESEFASWRQNRQTQRDSLRTVKEHQEVVGADGTHVGKVDHVRDDNILLTKTDRDAGGHHHSIPSSWIASVDDKVHLSKTAAEAQSTWRDSERRGGLFGGDDDDDRTFERGGHKLNRSFPGTY